MINEIQRKSGRRKNYGLKYGIYESKLMTKISTYVIKACVFLCGAEWTIKRDKSDYRRPYLHRGGTGKGDVQKQKVRDSFRKICLI